MYSPICTSPLSLMVERFASSDIYSSCTFLSKAIKLVKGWSSAKIGKLILEYMELSLKQRQIDCF